jgi:hypothetical protein
LIKNIHNELVTIKQKDNLFHDYVKTFPEKIKQLLIYKGCFVEDDEKNNKPKVNKTFKKHSSLRRVKMKRQRTNCVEFVGVSDDKERDIDFIDDDNDNDKEVENNDGISIYQRRKEKFKTGKLKVNFNIQEFAKQKNNILNANNNDNNSTHKINLFSKSEKNIKKNIKDSFLVVDQKKDIKDDNIKNKHINNTSISNSSEQKKIDGKKKLAINEKIIKHESQRGLVPKVSFQK